MPSGGLSAALQALRSYTAVCAAPPLPTAPRSPLAFLCVYSTSWSKTSVTERSNILLKIADIVEANLDHLAQVETLDNGKAIRESMAADLPLVIDHFRYFAGVIRAEEGSASEIDGNTLSLCIQEVRHLSLFFAV